MLNGGSKSVSSVGTSNTQIKQLCYTNVWYLVISTIEHYKIRNVHITSTTMLAHLQFLCVNCSRAICVKQVKRFTNFLFLFLCQFWFGVSLFSLSRCRSGNRWFLILSSLQSSNQLLLLLLLLRMNVIATL